MKYNTLQLKKGKEKVLERKHPWMFSGAFQTIPEGLEEGELVEIRDSRGGFRALGFYLPAQITVKVLSFEKTEDPGLLISQKLEAAIAYRTDLGLLDDPDMNCLRLVFGEGDGLPGLIIDKYDRTAVMQIHHIGWVPFLHLIANTLIKMGTADHVYNKPSEKINVDEAVFGSLAGNDDNRIIKEHGHLFEIDWAGGQKTGFFIDQRENRKRVGELATGKSVLNTFSYTGGFSVYALRAGATSVVSVDSSKPAIELANKNAELNGVAERHRGVAQDVFEHLKAEGDRYDIIILDPPAFAKSLKAQHNAVQAYKRLNLMAMEKIKPGGLIFTFSCSQHISPQLFEDTVRAAAIASGRPIRVVEKLKQPADHPVNIFHPEGAYLKGMILRVEPPATDLPETTSDPVR